METDLFNQSFYPETYRQKDVEKIIEQLVKFQPLTLVGLPRVGLARILRFILVHPEILTRRLKTNKIILAEIDINDLFGLKEVNFWQLVLKRISDETNDKGVKTLYSSAAKIGDAFTFFDNTKKAVTKLCAGGYCIFLFFDRFDRAVPLYSFLFFSHLQSLRDVVKTKINFLFTSNRPLEYLSPDIFKGGNLEVFSQKYFLKPSSYIDLSPIIKEFEESRKMNLCKEIKDLVYHYSGGHAQYALLILQILEKNIFNTKNIDFF